MTKLTLMIEASAATIARVLASIDNTDAIITATAPAAPIATAIPAMPTPAGSDDDETGDADAAPGSLDKNGLPWDERIHSTPAKLTTKGVWRAKRNVDAGLVAQVEAELRARAAAPVSTAPQPQATPVQPTPAPAPAPMPQPAAPAPVAAPQPGFVPPVTYPPVATPAPQPAAPVAAPALTPAPVAAPQPAAPVTLDFNGFMQKLSQLMAMQDANGAPWVDAAYLNTVCSRLSAAYQLPQPISAITELSVNQDWINYAIQLMQRDGKWQ